MYLLLVYYIIKKEIKILYINYMILVIYIYYYTSSKDRTYTNAYFEQFYISNLIVLLYCPPENI